MFCHRCGAQIRPDQPFCSACGTLVGPQPVRPSRVPNHLRTLAILWIVLSILRVLPLLGVFGFWPVLRHFTWGVPMPIMGFIGFLTGLGVVIGLAGVVVGWGLLERQLWARPMALVLGIVSLIHFPFGTILGIYTLWVLMPQESEQEYRRMACS